MSMQLREADVRELVELARERGQRPDLSRKDLSKLQFFKADLSGRI